MCNYCQYLGQGYDYEAKLRNVERHEKTCSENPEADITQIAETAFATAKVSDCITIKCNYLVNDKCTVKNEKYCQLWQETHEPS